MEQVYEYYQPDYFDKFKCDGQKCKAHCCRKWRIYIDKKTYKKYSHIKPKSAAQEILRQIKKCDDSDNYSIKLDENLSCPFLTEDNWCSIQKKYGEDFLSETCTSYPRAIFDFGDFYERALTLTCPVVAELVLFAEEPVKLEKIEINEKLHNKLIQLMWRKPKKIPQDLHNKFILIQQTEIFILRERSLTIDQRLMLLGLYTDRIEEIWVDIRLFDDIDKVSAIYQDSNFLREQVAQFSQVIEFNSHKYIETIIGLLETLYGEGNIQQPNDRKILDAFSHTLKLKTDEENLVKITPLAARYTELKEERQKFLQQFPTVFENYLINELIMHTVPFTSEETKLSYGYGIFVTLYKMFEILAFSVAMEGNSSKEDLLEVVMWSAVNSDHNKKYFRKVEDYVHGKSDIVQVMQNMLQV